MGDPSTNLFEERSASADESCMWTSFRTSSAQVASLNRQHLEFFMEYDRSVVSMDRKIGEGGQGCIYEAKLHLPYSFKPTSVVVKKFKPLQGVSQGHFPWEMASVKSFNLCLPLGFFFKGNCLCIILKRFTCDLRAAIDRRVNALQDEGLDKNGSPFGEEVATNIILQLAMGLKFLHELGVYHGDLKAANILIKTSGNNYDPLLSRPTHLVLADFERSDGIVGTGFFRAPEVLQSLRSRVSLSAEQWLLADIYSFGMVCYEVLTGRFPFEGHLLSDFDLVLNGGRPELPDHVPESLRDLVVRCWHADPHSRPRWDEILEVLSQYDAALFQHGDNPTQLGDSPANGGFRSYIANMVSLESLSFESLIHESKHLIRDLTARHERDSESFRIEFMPYYWASECVATAEEYASKFEVDPPLASPLMCSFQESFERIKLCNLLNHQLLGFAYRFASFGDVIWDEQVVSVLDYAQETIPRGERLIAVTVILVQKVSQGINRVNCTEEFEVGTSWPGKLLFFHDAVKWVLWYEHVGDGWARQFMMKRLLPTKWNLDVDIEALLMFCCTMGNAYIYVLAMITIEPLLLSVQFGLYMMKGSNNILYRSSGERVCRFQQAWIYTTTYKVGSIIFSFSFVTLLMVYGWKGILGWILFPCILMYTPYGQLPLIVR